MSDQAVPVAKRHPSRWQIWVLAVAIPIAFWQAAMSLVAALGVFPIADSSLIVIIVVAVLSRRWEGAARGWFRATLILAVLMVVEWVPLWVAIATQHMFGTDLLNVGFWVYSVESILLLAMYVIASALSIRGIRRARTVAV
jgi:hypothetical protein